MLSFIFGAVATIVSLVEAAGEIKIALIGVQLMMLAGQACIFLIENPPAGWE